MSTERPSKELGREGFLEIEKKKLPADTRGVSVVLSPAHISYSTVGQILNDVKTFFVGQATDDDSYAKTREHTNDPIWAYRQMVTARELGINTEIFDSLCEELKVWESGTDPEFTHSQAGRGSAYKYSGSKFEGNTIVVRRDQSGYTLDIEGRGNGTIENDPSHLLRAFAHGLDKPDAVVFEGEPIITFVIDPTEESLRDLARGLPAEGGPYETQTPVSLGELYRYYEKMLGLSPEDEARTEAMQLNPWVRVLINGKDSDVRQVSVDDRLSVRLWASSSNYNNDARRPEAILPTVGFQYVPPHFDPVGATRRSRFALAASSGLASKWDVRSSEWKNIGGGYLELQQTKA